MAHLIKTEDQIEEEIRRRAQAAADAASEGTTIPEIHITATPEPTQFGSHWLVGSAPKAVAGYIEAAAIEVAAIWDIRVPA
jgi:hypothetical protein